MPIEGTIGGLTLVIQTSASGGGGGSGTVTSLSVVTANGFAGTVASATSTPAITLTTTVNGLVKGNGTALTSAQAGVDYQAAGNYITALSGDVTATGPGGVTATLANTTVSAGSYTNANVTIDSKGRITTATNGSSGSGTVTSAGLVMPNIFAVAGSPITTQGNFVVTLSAQAEKQIFVSPASATGVPTFRTMLASDLPVSTVSAGSYTNTNVTVDAYGRITTASNGSGGGVTNVANSDGTLVISPTSGNVVASRAQITGDVIVSAASNTSVLATTAVSAGSYTSANITVDSKGRLTSASNGSSGTNGTLNVNTTAVGNITTGEDNLITYSVPGGTLSTNGDYLLIDGAGTFAASLNNKRVRIYLGSTVIFDSGSLAITAATSWKATGFLIRESSTTFTASIEFSTSSATLSAYASVVAGTETLANALTLKFTGEATADNDIIQESMITRLNSSSSVAPITDGDKDDITVSSSGTVWTIDNNAVTDAKLRQSSGLSVIGNTTNVSANPADIIAASDHQVFRRSGTAVAFGAINLAQANAVTGILAIANGGTNAATAASARSSLSAASVTQTFGLAGKIGTVANQDYDLIIEMPFGGTISKTSTKCTTGTATMTFKINTTALGGTANSVSAAQNDQTQASSNVFVAGDDIRATISSNASCANISWTAAITRTLSS